ncbi:MAG: pilus assembly protein, partial [Rhodoferax sp.]|nr:pilus assembly protein [Rhodoferax sp.]
GARLLSSWPTATLSSSGVGTVQTLVSNSANAAKLSPPLTTGGVLVQCLNQSFGAITCTDGAAPANVRVSITGFTVNLGDWFPFIGTDGLISLPPVPLQPHTTMRYLK